MSGQRSPSIPAELEGSSGPVEAAATRLGEGDDGDGAVAAPEPLARAMADVGRGIADFFDGDLFADPVRDLLLELFIAGAMGEELPAAALCAAAGVPQAAGLRYLELLDRRGIVVSRPDPHRPGGSCVGLSDGARRQLRAYLRAASLRLSQALGSGPASA